MSDTISAILFWAMLIMSFFVFIYPWRVRGRVSRVLAHVPVLFPILLVIYETLMPRDENIRADLIVLLGLFVLVSLCYAAKLVLWKRTGKRRWS